MSETITVLIVDDNALLRTGLRYTIEEEPGVEVAGEASNGIEALELYTRLQPSIVTMDYQMPQQDGLAASQNILSRFPKARILLLSGYQREEDVWKAWQTGVTGYLNKPDAGDCIIEAIREVAASRRYFPAKIAEKIKWREEQESLTPRELEVLRQIVKGCSNKEIMINLKLSARTVSMHVSNMLEKLGAQDRTQAAITAISRGIVHLDPEKSAHDENLNP